MSGCTTRENSTDDVHKMKYISISHYKKKKQIFYLFHAFNPFLGELSQNTVPFYFVITCGIPPMHSNILQYYLKRKKCKLNYICPSGCEACTFYLGN